MLKFNKENFIALIYRNKKLTEDRRKLRKEITNLHKSIERLKVKKLKHLFHVYKCARCDLTFAVEQAFEDHSDVCCPVCCDDDLIVDIASGEMIFGTGGENNGN